MSALAKRVEDLEKVSRPESHDVWIVQCVSPGRDGGGPVYREPVALTTAYEPGAWRIEREEAEHKDAFHKRAADAVPRNGVGLPVLLEVYES